MQKQMAMNKFISIIESEKKLTSLQPKGVQKYICKN